MDNFFKNRKNNIIFTSCLLLITIVITIFSGKIFSDFSNYEAYFYVRPEITVEKFSDYSPKLKGTAGDADIYVLDSGVKGPSILVLGGTHPNEPSGQITATVLLENINITKGKFYIITEANRSAYTHSHPQEASAMYYAIETASGLERIFKFGSRATNTNEQWPNPDVYVHALSGQKLSTNDTRNLNRAYPGSENGTYTERVAYAITELIKKNDIVITIDLHEASPEYQTINAIIYHDDASKIASSAALLIDMQQVLISTELSPSNLHGLSHRELGDYTDTFAFLCETSNASQGKIRGAFTEDLITTGNDKFYKKAEELGLLYAAPVDISVRVARHLLSIDSIIKAYNMEVSRSSGFIDISEERKEYLNSLGKFEISGIPSYEEVINYGVGFYLHDPE